MTTTLFGRAARLTVQRQGQTIGEDGLQFNSVFSGLRISFRLEKSPTMLPNHAEIMLYNASVQTRRQLQSYGAGVLLEVGYSQNRKSDPSRIDWAVAFKGNARTIDHVRRGADWITKIQSGDGEVGYRYSLANQSFKENTTFKDAATYLAKQLQGIDVSGFLKQLQSGGIIGAVQQFVNGTTMYGNAGEELERLMVAAGYQLSIQDEELVAVKLLAPSALVHVLSPTTGLIGSPEHGTPERSGLPSPLKAKCLLRAQIRPGDRVRFQDISDERINGDYFVFKLVHIGDTYANDWYTELECRPTPPL